MCTPNQLIDGLSAADMLHTELSSRASLLSWHESCVLHVHIPEPIDSLSAAD